MAGLQEWGSSFRLFFRFQGKQRTFSLGEVSEQEAEPKSAKVNCLLLLLRQRLIELPPGVEISEFLQHDGRPPELAPVRPRGNAHLVTLRDRFLDIHARAHEKSALYTARIHFNHLIATLGEKFPLPELVQADLQRHVDRRTGKGIAPVTIRKETNGYRATRNWARRIGLVSKEWPGKGLVYQKSSEKPPFQTRADISRKIVLGGLTDAQESELWESLYLTAEEHPEFLQDASQASRHAFI